MKFLVTRLAAPYFREAGTKDWFSVLKVGFWGRGREQVLNQQDSPAHLENVGISKA